MYAYTSYGLSGLGDDGPDLSFLGGSVTTALVLGIGVIVLFNVLDVKPRSRQKRQSRGEYVKYVSGQHKLSKSDQQYLMEHEE